MPSADRRRYSFQCLVFFGHTAQAIAALSVVLQTQWWFPKKHRILESHLHRRLSFLQDGVI